MAPRPVSASAACRRIALVALILAVPSWGPVPASALFRVDELADGVHLFRPEEDDFAHTNSLVVERDDGLLVVEAQPTPAAARELLAAIAEVSSAPVRYLVLGHPHAESSGGATAFPEATLVVSSHRGRDALLDESSDFAAESRLRADDPEKWIPPPRVVPELVVHALTELQDSRRPVQIVPLPHAHSRGDVSVVLPEQRITYLGPVLFRRGNPYARDASTSGWIGVLNQTLRTEVAIVVPLRGPAGDLETVRGDRDSLAWIRGQVAAGFVDQVPVDRISAKVLEAEKLGSYFGGGPGPQFLPTLTEKIVEETVVNRRKMGYR